MKGRSKSTGDFKVNIFYTHTDADTGVEVYDLKVYNELGDRRVSMLGTSFLCFFD